MAPYIVGAGVLVIIVLAMPWLQRAYPRIAPWLVPPMCLALSIPWLAHSRWDNVFTAVLFGALDFGVVQAYRKSKSPPQNRNELPAAREHGVHSARVGSGRAHGICGLPAPSRALMGGASILNENANRAPDPKRPLFLWCL